MKLKFYFPFICLIIMVYSCKKENKSDNVPAEKTYPVKFTVGASIDGDSFVQAGRNLVTAAATPLPASAVVGNLIYLVYGSNGVYRQLQLNDSTANFNTINDSLPAGTYTVVVLGNALSIWAPYPSAHTLSEDSFYVNPGKDLFRGEVTFTVSSSPVTQSITLTRISEKLVMKSNNVVPTRIDSLRMLISEAGMYRVDALTPVAGKTYSRTLHHIFTPAERGMANFQMSAFVYSNKINVTITEYFQGSVVKTISLTNIQGIRNEVTTGTGNMFLPDPVTTNSFQVSSSPNWNNQLSTN